MLLRFSTSLFALTLLIGDVSQVSAEDRNEELMQEAARRIETYRMADATIAVVDATGHPVSGALLRIDQTRHAFLFGCNIFRFGKARNELDEQAYRQQFASLFNYATIGFYWPSYEPRSGEPNHEYAARVARWCREQGITAKGHPLAWNFLDPRWLPDNSAEIRRLQMDRIADCVGRFRGLIDYWDVVNEATHFDRDEFRRRAPKITKMWEETGQMEFVDQCFQVARQAGPSATLVINDYRTDRKYEELIERMARPDDKRAYDVIGIQSHMHNGVWDNQKIWEVCERFAHFHVPLHFTELTILSGKQGWEKSKPWSSTPPGEQSQAKDVRRVYTMLFSHPSVTAITWWDFADLNAWQGAPAGLLGKSLQPKPAYNVLMDLVKKQWWTRVKQATDEDGQVAFRGFRGDYQVTVSLETGKELRANIKLIGDQVNQFQISLN